MNLTLVFSRKYRWTEHYFSVCSLGSFQKLLTTNPFLVSTIFFTIMNVSFFSLRFDLFSIIAKEVNQIRNNVVCVVARCALTTGRCNAFQHNFVNLKKSEFYGPYFQTMLFLVTMVVSGELPRVKFPHGEFPWGKFPRGKLPRILFSNYFCWKNISPLKNLIFYLRGRLT